MINQNPNSNPPRLKFLDFSLRISIIPLSIASLWLSLTNNEHNPDYGTIHFFNFTALKYMISIAAIAAGYAFVAAISIWIPFLVNKTLVFFVFDQVMAYLMVTSGAAGAELWYLVYKGDVQVSWSEACTSYAKFCNNLKISVFLQFLVLFCFLVLAVISAFRAFTIFDPPLDVSQPQIQQVQRT
ncbi:CASP-like protein 2D1 [Amaranthus tricolor]|uniref:CASP-like protein 2D1 n=1 Tax=Amaranthus tricolor TaxID=29722 RepID=UPI00258FF3D2|nr:CASP-like protein 2D1 [Amaranthus tricolor]